jgi:hypothetical protein
MSGLWNELEEYYWQVSVWVGLNKVVPSTVCCFMKLLPNQSSNLKWVHNDGCGSGDCDRAVYDDDVNN